MKIYSVFDEEFRQYGLVLEGFDFSDLVAVCSQLSPKPTDSFVYEASVPALEHLPVSEELKNRTFGGMPIQIGYCNGTNHTLNCLEYHKSSELNIAVDPVILLLGCQTELRDYQLDTSKVKAFLVPNGIGVELFATTLHYAPCSVEPDGYRVLCVLPRGTNAPAPHGLKNVGEDRLCLGTNKWLIAHKDAPEVNDGAFVGILGENLTITD